VVLSTTWNIVDNEYLLIDIMEEDIPNIVGEMMGAEQNSSHHFLAGDVEQELSIFSDLQFHHL
jgi:hypothetical protein